MARVKTFRIHPDHGVPDKDIREFLNLCEKECVVNVSSIYIPAVGKADPRLTVIVTKLDDIQTVSGEVGLDVDDEPETPRVRVSRANA